MTDNATGAPEGTADDQAIWDQLAARERGDDVQAPPAAVSEPVVPVETPEPPAAKTNDDPWSTAPAPLRTAYEEALRKAERAENASQSAAGKIQYLQRELNTANAKAKAPEQAAPAQVLNTPAFAKAREEYPEVFGPLEETLKAVVDQNTNLAKTFDDRFKAVDQERAEQFFAQQQAELTRLHPDWLTQTQKPEFGAWLAAQPQYVKDGLQRNADRIHDAVEAADIIARFKGTQAPPAQAQTPSPQHAAKRQQQLESAVAPKGRTVNTQLSNGPPEGASEAELWAYFDKLDKAKSGTRR